MSGRAESLEARDDEDLLEGLRAWHSLCPHVCFVTAAVGVAFQAVWTGLRGGEARSAARGHLLELLGLEGEGRPGEYWVILNSPQPQAHYSILYIRGDLVLHADSAPGVHRAQARRWLLAFCGLGLLGNPRYCEAGGPFQREDWECGWYAVAAARGFVRAFVEARGPPPEEALLRAVRASWGELDRMLRPYYASSENKTATEDKRGPAAGESGDVARLVLGAGRAARAGGRRPVQRRARPGQGPPPDDDAAGRRL